ncbi:MAG: Holliday junction resolvase RuvX [Candidatus Zixiibacteriota bacterium]
MKDKTDRVYLGIDYGERRVGLAVSDAGAQIAGTLTTVEATSARRAAGAVLEAVSELDPIGIVIGYPVAPDGGEGGESCAAVDRFIRVLEKITDLPIYRQEERDTSATARGVVHAHGKRVGRKRRQSGAVDRIAAALILQRWLDEHAGR